LQQGVSSVLELMHPYWKQESELAQLVEKHRALSAADYSLTNEEDYAQLDRTVCALHAAQKGVFHNPEHSQRLGELIEFVQQFRQEYPNETSEQSFERIQVLRRWLFWLPASMLQGRDSEFSALAILSQFFAVGVALDRFYPEMGGSHLGALSIGPIEEMYRILAANNAADPFNHEIRQAMTLMDLPRRIVARYRSRLGWSPRSSVEHYSPGPPSPYHGLPEYHLASSSSLGSASPSYAAYTPPLQSPPAVTVAGSPFHLDNYVTAAPSHTLYPSSSQPLDTHDPQLGLSDLSHAGSIPHSSAFTPPYGREVLCAEIPRAGSTLGPHLEVYPQTHLFETPGMVAPGTCWT